MSRKETIDDVIIINSEVSKAEAHREIDRRYAEHPYQILRIQEGKKVTLTQKKSLHLWCQWIADALNDGGFDQRKVIKPGFKIPWTKDAVKENLWRPVQIALLKKESTKDPDRDEYNEVYQVVDRKIQELTGIHIEWPNKKTDSYVAETRNED